jgi:hypothetical protein
LLDVHINVAATTAATVHVDISGYRDDNDDDDRGDPAATPATASV